MNSDLSMSHPLDNLIDILYSHRSEGVGKITLTQSWGCLGHDVGPGICYFDIEMKPFPDKGMRGFSKVRECLELFRSALSMDPELVGRRKVLDNGFLANRLELTVFPDRRLSMAWSFDGEMDRLELEKTKKYLNKEEVVEAELELAEYLEHKGRSRKLRVVASEPQAEVSNPSPVLANESVSWSIPELFQAIVNTATDAAPKGWTKVAIDGQVWVDTDASGRALNNVAADFQAQMPDGTVSQINPQQPIAAMNALTLLNKQLRNHEGEPWRRLRVVFESTGPRQVAYDFDQEGLWRPEIK